MSEDEWIRRLMDGVWLVENDTGPPKTMYVDGFDCVMRDGRPTETTLQYFHYLWSNGLLPVIKLAREELEALYSINHK